MLEDFFINASAAKKKKKIAPLTQIKEMSDIIDTSDVWVCSLKLLVNMCPDFSECGDLTFKFVELLGEFIKQEAKVRAAELSPRRSAPSCDGVTDVTGQIDAACKCFLYVTAQVQRCLLSSVAMLSARKRKCLPDVVYLLSTSPT